MDLGQGVAANEALRENMFVLLVSVLNSIPIFVVGKPGSSKSLAVSILLANLRGKMSASAFLRSFPAVESFFHQCSPQSTSQGILQTWNTARKYGQNAPNTVVIAYLDEIGLAEQSPHLPLKVLHKILDKAEPGETVVGISNWALDPAKINRAVHLHRPAPTVDDLALTAKGMLQCESGDGASEGGASINLLLRGLASAYESVYRGQKLPDFWGLREFYALVRTIGQRSLVETTVLRQQSAKAGGPQSMRVNISDQTVALAVLRNFGGRSPLETNDVLQLFFRVLLSREPPPAEELPGVTDVVRENLGEEQARHLMLLTKNNAALSLLFDLKLLDHSDTEVLFGSDFPGDKTDMQVSVDIQTVKACMARGGTVVLVHCDRFYESMYDLLNQHYTRCAGKLFVRLAMGAQSQLCPLDPQFRVVVVVESADAYERLASPLLNRFEKQVLGWKQAVNLCQPRPLFEGLLCRVRGLAHALANGGSNGKVTTADMRRVFPGYGTAFLPSLVLAVSELTGEEKFTKCKQQREIPGKTVMVRDELYEACSERLLAVATSKAICRLTGRRKGRPSNCVSLEGDLKRAAEEFQRNAHGSLEEFSRGALRSVGNSDLVSLGTSAVVMTYAPLEGDSAAKDLRSSAGGSWRVCHVVIHELSQEREFRAQVEDFFGDEAEEDVLLLQCDLQASPIRMIEQVKFVVENERATFVKKATESGSGRRKPRRVRNVHVVLLLHLIRGDDCFQMTFDTRWAYAFVDSVGDGGSGTRGEGGLPTAVDASGKSLLDVVSRLDPSEVLLLTMRPALAHLDFSPDRLRDMEEVRSQMEVLLPMCSGSQSPLFVQAVWGSILHRLEHHVIHSGSTFQDPEEDEDVDHSGGWEETKGEATPEIEEKRDSPMEHGTRGRDEDVAQAASTDQQLRVAGNFRRAIRASVLKTATNAFSEVLSHMDRNAGLLLLKSDSVRDTWISLFQGMGGQIVAKATLRSQGRRKDDRFTVHDSFAGPGEPILRSRFPYSFYVFHLLQSKKAHKRNDVANAGISEEQLQRQFALLQMDDRLHENLSRSAAPEGNLFGDFDTEDEVLLKQYMHDFTCIVLKSIRGVPREDQAIYVLGFLDIVGPSSQQNGGVSWTPVRSLAAVHHRFWRQEHAIRLHCKLLDAAGPAAFERALGVIRSYLHDVQRGTRVGGINPTVHVMVARATQVSLGDPDALIEQTIVPSSDSASKSPAAWALRVDGADRATENILVAFVNSRSLHDISLGGNGHWQQRVLGELREGWARLWLMRRLVLDVITPLSVPPQATLAVLQTLREEAGAVRSKEFLVSIVRALVYLAISAQLCTPWRRCEVTHPAALLEVLPRFLQGYLSITFTSEAAVDEAIESRRAVGDICEALVAVLSRHPGYFVEKPDEWWVDHGVEVSGWFSTVWPREAACVQGVRCLRALSSALKGRAEIGDCLRAGLAREVCAGWEGSCDYMLTACVATTMEEDKTVDQAIMFTSDTRNRSRLTNIEEEGAAVEKALTVVGCLRKLARAAAEALCAGEDPAGLVEHLLNSLKSDNGGPSMMACSVGGARNPAMFFLRNVVSHEAGGEEFIRQRLQHPPLNRFPWSLVDSRISDFTADDKLPQVNPLVRVPFFEQCREMVSLFIGSGDAAQLEAGIQRLVDEATPTNGGRAEDGLPALTGGLLAGVFHEANLVQALGGHDDRSETRLQLQKLLLDESASRSLSFLRLTRRRIIAAFVGDTRGHARSWFPKVFSDGRNGDSTSANDFLCLRPDSTLEEVLLARLAAHVAAAFVSADPTSPMAFFSVIATTPDVLRKAYIPAMDTTITLQQIALAGGRPHQCDCGYIYVITECMRSMERLACPQEGCGRALGGENHILVQANSDSIKPPEARGYYLKYTEADDVPTVAVRDMSAEQVASTRLVMHLAGIIGAAASASEWAGKASVMATLKGVGMTGNETGRDVTDAFLRGARADAAAIRRLTNRNHEQMALGMHLALFGAHNSVDELDEPGAAPGGDSSSLTATLLRDEAGRAIWEAQFCLQYLNALSGERTAVSNRLTASIDELRRDGEGAAFAVELVSGDAETRERGERTYTGSGVGHRLNTLTTGSRLWGLRHEFSQKDFIDTFWALGRTTDDQSPLLAMLTDGNTLSLRLALQHLPAALEWIHVLKQSLGGMVDREEARTRTVGGVLESACAEDRGGWQEAFIGFSEAWRHGRGLVDRWECEAIPSHYALESVDRKTPLSACLPSLADEGIFPLALLMYLAEQHNRIVRRAREVNPAFGQGVDDVEPRHVTKAHAIALDLERSASLLQESQCDGKLGCEAAYDFDKAEFHLGQATLSSVPVLRIEKEDIIFLYSGDFEGADTLLGRLGKKIPQKRLGRADREAIARDISTPALAQSLLDTIDPAIGILASLGGNLVQTLPPETVEMTLGDFLRDVLHMGAPVGRSAVIDDVAEVRGGGEGPVLPPSVARHVQLQHLSDLWEMTISLTGRQWASGVSVRFREELPASIAQTLAEAADAMGDQMDVLLPLFKNYISQFLQKDTTSASSTIKDNLDWLQAGDDHLKDLDWFANNWPPTIQMRYALSTFEMMESRSFAR